MSLDASSIQVPFDLYGNSILVKTRINNSAPVWCVFDSGASINVLNERAARRLKLTSGGSSDLQANGGTVSGSVVEHSTLDLGGVKAVNQSIAVVPLDDLAAYSGRDVQGIIGNNFISNFVVEIDYAHHTLIFHNPQKYSLSKDPDAIEIQMHDGNPFVKVEFSSGISKQTIADYFEVDTGSSGTFSIYRPFAERYHLLQTIPRAKTAEGRGGAGVGGATKYIDARIDNIKIGQFTLYEPVISISNGAEASDSETDTGIIGTDLLRRFTVTLDYRAHRMRLVANANFREPFEVDLSGLELVTEADNFNIVKIKNVRDGFPAAAAGLRAGDTIVLINNRPAAGYGLDKLSKMFRQVAQTYQLTVKRGSKIINTRLKMKRII